MANDIAKANSASDIKNGTVVICATPTGEYEVLDNAVKNTPSITDIQAKYDERFDETTYYST